MMHGTYNVRLLVLLIKNSLNMVYEHEILAREMKQSSAYQQHGLNCHIYCNMQLAAILT